MANPNQNSLRLVWRGMQGDERISGATWQPTKESDPIWSMPGLVGAGACNSTHGPALAVDPLNFRRYMVWKGSGGDGRIWTTELSGIENRPRVLAGPEGPFMTTDRPAMAVLEDQRRLLAWRAPDGALVWAIQEAGGPWSAQVPTGAATSHGPALVTFEDQVLMAWKAADDTTIWSAWFKGGGWTVPRPAPMAGGAARTSDVPALARTDHGLVMAWKGASDAFVWWTERTGGSQWPAPRTAEPSSGAILTSHGPAVAMARRVLHLEWKGVGDQHIWWSQRQDDGRWTPSAVINPGINTFASPALVGYAVFFL